MILRKLLILLALTAFTLTSGPYGRSQSSQSGQSLADAARKAREQQKNEPKSAKVFTDDDVANLKGQISVVGNLPPAPAPAVEDSAAAKAAAGSAAPAKGEAYWRKKFADARHVLADDTREADVLQREYNLKQTQFYSNPNVALREQYSRKDLDDTLAELNKKKADVDKDNEAMSNLQDQLRQAGGDAGWANEPTSNASTESGDVCADDGDADHDQQNPASGAAPATQQAAPAPGQPDQAQPPAASQQQPQ